MPDAEKQKRWEHYHHQWRGVAAPEDTKQFDTALLISDKLAKLNANQELKLIEAQLVDKKSQWYKEIEDPHGKSTFGAVLFAVLSLEDYIKKTTLENAEKLLLESALEQLKNLYATPSKESIAAFIEKTQQWLDTYALQTTNPVETKEISVCLYAALQILLINLKEPSFGYGLIASRLRPPIEKMMPNLKEKITALTKMQPLASAQEDATLNTKLENHYRAVYETNDNPLSALKEELGATHAHLTSLIELKEAEEQLSHANHILKAFKENESYSYGRAYARDLIKKHEDSFASLIEHRSDKEEWLERKQALEAGNATLAALSWISALPTIAYRKVTPSDLQQYINEHTPETLDSSFKNDIMNLAETRISELKAKIATLNEKARPNTYIENEASIKRELEAAPLSELRGLLQLTKDRSEFIGICHKFHEEVHKYQQLVHQTKEFVDAFNGFGTRFSRWLSETIPSLFKPSEKVMAVSEALALQAQVKEELNALYKDYQVLKLDTVAPLASPTQTTTSQSSSNYRTALQELKDKKAALASHTILQDEPEETLDTPLSPPP